MDIGDEMVAGQRVADQDGVRSVGVQRAVGAVGDGESLKLEAAVEPHRPLVPSTTRWFAPPMQDPCGPAAGPLPGG